VGQRVVLRRLVRGETGPTGGPAFTDVLGVMESWSGGRASVRTASGELVSVAVADIVSGKPVPPRPSPRQRVSPSVAERRALASWPAPEVERLGEWVLRAAGGFSARANSVLADGDPGVPLPEALTLVEEFYTVRRLPAWAQVVVGAPTHDALAGAGWRPARPGEDDTLFQLASVSAALRAARRSLPSTATSTAPEVEVLDHADPGWLADDARSRDAGAVARAVLEGPPETGFAAVRDPGSGLVVAKGRVARGRGTEPGDQDWAGITDVWVSPAARGRGLATGVVAALLEWAAERGATTAYLQVRGDNPGALALYERLGFRTHHAYRYLAPQ
jgi:GNAT superfamily N-acetyltransferase